MLRVPPIPMPAFVAGASVRDRVAESIDGRLELLERNAETWLEQRAQLRVAAGGGAFHRGDEARERTVDRVTEVVGITTPAAEHPETCAVRRGYSGMAESVSRERLKRGRLTRYQAQAVLEETLLHIGSVVLASHRHRMVITG
jgi:hypothetical protein